MYAVTEVTNEQYEEPSGSRLAEVWESGLTKPPSVAIRSLHNVVNRYLRVTRPEEAEDVSNGNVDIIVYLARHDNEEIFPSRHRATFRRDPIHIMPSVGTDGAEGADRPRVGEA